MRNLTNLICGAAAVALLSGCAHGLNHHDQDRDRDHQR